jgi:hypothetical protein
MPAGRQAVSLWITTAVLGEFGATCAHAAASVKVANSAVGIPCRRMTAFAKAFKLSQPPPGRPEDAQAAGDHVDHAAGQRRLGADDGQRDLSATVKSASAAKW